MSFLFLGLNYLLIICYLKYILYYNQLNNYYCCEQMMIFLFLLCIKKPQFLHLLKLHLICYFVCYYLYSDDLLFFFSHKILLLFQPINNHLKYPSILGNYLIYLFCKVMGCLLNELLRQNMTLQENDLHYFYHHNFC